MNIEIINNILNKTLKFYYFELKIFRSDKIRNF